MTWAAASRWISKSRATCFYLVGLTKNELGGSHFALVEGLSGGEVPQVDPSRRRRLFAAVHEAIRCGVGPCVSRSFRRRIGRRRGGDGLRRRTWGEDQSCTNIQWENGNTARISRCLLFSESNTRFLCEVKSEKCHAFEALLDSIPHARSAKSTTLAGCKLRRKSG